MNNSDKNTEPQINAQIIKCFKNLEPWELKKYEELSDYMIKTASESSQRLNFQQNLTLDNIEEGKKHCQFPEEMMKSVWIFMRIKASQTKRSTKGTPNP